MSQLFHLRNLDLTKGSIKSLLYRLTWPSIFGIATVFLFNVVDTFFVGKLGVNELAAIGYTFPVSFTVISLSLGISIGITAVVSKAYGAKDMSAVKRLTTHGVFLAVGNVTAIAGLGLIFQDEIFRMLGASPDLIPLITSYTSIWFLAVGCLVIPMAANGAVRATGDTKTPSIVMFVSGGLNAILDPLLIFGLGPFPKMGFQGAAVATAISWVFSLGVGFYVLYKKELLEIAVPKINAVIDSWKKISYVGFPAAATNMLNPIAAAIITRLISDFGKPSIAAYGVGARLEPIFLVVVLGLTASLPPLIGQNLGAKKIDRIIKSFDLSIVFSIGLQVVIAGLVYIFSDTLAVIFSEHHEVHRQTAFYLSILPVSYVFHACLLLVASALNTIGKPMVSTWLSVFRLFILTIPMVYVGGKFWGIYGVFSGLALANAIGGLTGLLVGRYYIHKLK